MPLIKRILFPVDFSDSCIGASRYIEAFAGHFEAEIIMLNIVGMGEHNLAEELLPVRQRQLDAFMAEEFKYFATQRLCVIGDDPAQGVVDAAKRWSPDLIMMPTHGLGVFDRLLFGSVTAKVLQDVECPVWTGVHSDAAPILEDIHCRKVLCAIDLARRSKSILEWAAWFAEQRGAVLGIVHATAELPTAFYEENREEELAEALSERSLRRISALQTAAGTSGQVFIECGDPAETVAGTARRFGADLVVVGRHRMTGIAGYLSHNAYSILSDSPCPVISI